jgi:hypothetical protein
MYPQHADLTFAGSLAALAPSKNFGQALSVGPLSKKNLGLKNLQRSIFDNRGVLTKRSREEKGEISGHFRHLQKQEKKESSKNSSRLEPTVDLEP